jgi:hypothetical protein
MWERRIQWPRISALKSLGPAKCYLGEEQWFGYVVFEFARSDRVVLECPVEGNAIYVLWGDWKSMVTHTKRNVWTHFSQNYRRIVHKGKWLALTRRALKLH